ncbi:MAG: dihydroorotate dehydrogenase [Eubacteriales bacterium]|nr:dihydroorotate dehydrogenase [Eubacteriales bacterium]
MVNTHVQIGELTLKNPVIAASGTFGFGREMQQWNNLSQIGGISSKGLTLNPRLGNDPTRVAETASGMLNSVGLQNPGLQAFIEHELPFMLGLGTTVIANIAGHSLEENVQMAMQLDQTAVHAIELNLSCPNVNKGCMAFGSSAHLIQEVVRAVRQSTTKPLWVKLTPNVTAISEMALAAESAGADAVCLINTLLGMAIDRRSRRPVLRNNTGGLSGPAVKPVALRMVWDVAKSVSIPVIGMGGIMTGEDALEFMIAGATAVQVGTANLVKPTACQDIINEMIMIATAEKITSFSQYTGTLKTW